MNKKTLLTLFSLLLFLSLIMATTNPVAANWVLGQQQKQPATNLLNSGSLQAAATPTPTPQAALPTPTLISIPPDNILTLEQLGKAEQIMQGPYDSRTLVLSLPSSWKLSPGVQFDMIFSISYNNLAGTIANAGQAYGGTLTVSFNGIAISILQIDQVGEHTLHFNIPEKALVSRRLDGRHDLTITLDSGLNCDINHQVTLVLRPASRLILPHTLVSPTTDFTRFPQPFSQDPAWPDSALIVLPDQPSAAEIQSALTVGGALRNLTSTAFTLDLTTESKLTPELQTTNNLVLVGKAASFKMLGQLSLPEAINANGVNVPGAGADDGILEMVVSPWNANKVVMLVSGVSDAGVPKASQAVSTGFIRPTDKSNVAVISTVDLQPVPQAIPVDQTLAQLGYDLNATTDRLNRPGTASSIFFFYTAPGTVAGNDASFTLQFNHSALLNFARSGLTVLVNNQPIGSFRFTEESAQTKNTVTFQIPAPALLPGRNQLEVRTDLFPTDNCTSPQLAGLWVSLWSESLLHLPTITLAAGGVSLYDMSLYPVPFIQHPTMDNTAFIVSPNDLNGWKTALTVAADLGDRLNGQMITLKAYYADAIPDTAKSEDHLIVIGRPNAIPLITDLHDQLPGPFDPGSELAIEKNTQVAYRLGANAQVGYLELLNSPWNKERVILTVLGNSEEGLQQAGIAITTPTLRNRLAGDFALVTNGQLTITDTRIKTSTTIDTASQTTTKTAVNQGSVDLVPYKASQPGWILPIMIGSFIVMILILIAVLINGITKRTSTSAKK